MKTIKFIYKNKKSLKEIINGNDLTQKENILIQIFSNNYNKNKIQTVSNEIKTLMPKGVIVGNTSVGINNNGNINNNEIVISISIFNKVNIKSIGFEINNSINNKNKTIEISNKIISNDTKLIIIFSNGNNQIIEDIFNRLYILHPDIIISGGISNKDTNGIGYIFDNNNVFSNGIVMISLSGNELFVNNFYNFNWIGIGKPLQITKAKGNSIIEINNKPAIEILSQHIGNNNIVELEEIFSQIPIIFKKHGFEVAKQIINIEKNGIINLSGKINEGEEFQFGFGNPAQLVNKTNQILNKLLNFPIEEIFIYGCIGRKNYLGDYSNNEIKYLNNFGNTTGFYGNGNFFCSNGQSQLLNFSLTGISLSENNIQKKLDIDTNNTEKQNKLINGITNLIKHTSDELIKSNEANLLEIEEKIKEIEKSRNNFFESYTKIIEEVPAAIWMGDHEEKTLYANKKFLEMVEYNLDEIKGRLSYNFRDNSSRFTVQDNNELRSIGEKSTYNGVLKSKTGKLIPVCCTGIPVHFGTVGMMIDQRELKKSEEEKANLKRLNNLKNDFINIVSHDLRTPMTSIKGYVSMLIDGDFGQINKNALDALNIVYKSAERLVYFINDMLDISKLESGKMTFNFELLNIQEFLKEIQDEYMGYIKAKKLNLIIINNVNNLTINSDRSKLKQVMTNLVGNAIKFTQENGTITIQTSKKDNKLKVEVIDTGIGIDKSNIEKIFTKFGQVDNPLTRSQNGTGLGLNICKEIIKQLGGELKLKSTLGKGSNFYYYLNLN